MEDKITGTSHKDWDNRYKKNQFGWDLGEISPPIKNYIDGLHNKDLKILIPGCGLAWEGEYLHLQGFKNVFLMDVSPIAKKRFLDRVPSFNPDNYLLSDFFMLKDTFDLMIEQTFFCAIDPSLRESYIQQLYKILPKGKLVGLMFDAPLNTEHPPYGGSSSEYKKRFSNFKEISISPCKISAKPRLGREVWVEVLI